MTEPDNKEDRRTTLTKIYGAAIQGIDATLITIEVSSTRGCMFYMVGLPDSAVRESQQRIQAAFNYLGIKQPLTSITVNMAPADIRKEGSAYDLSIAIGLLGATGIIKTDHLGEYMLMGELGLDGSLQPIKGALPIAIKARELGFKGLILPAQNAKEASVVNKLEVYGAENLKDVADFLDDKAPLQQTTTNTREEFFAHQNNFDLDFADVKGQETAKRALEIAAAGSHNIIMIGSPGSGKSMLAKRLPSILPPLSLAESLETTKIHSVAGKLGKDGGLIYCRPFRNPHHTISAVAMIGGGTYPQPGEISLAHNGILFLDELAENRRETLEVLRQPLEDRVVTISRAKFSVQYPASFMLVAAMNPCPCGYYNHPTRRCVCTPGQVHKYLNRVSGPLMDRFDIQIEVTPVPFEKISETAQPESSSAIRERVIRARNIQEKRFSGMADVHCNAQMTSRMIREYAQPDSEGLEMLRNAMTRLSLSARAYDRILKVSRTIADLEGSPDVKYQHIAEAINYRNLDRENWVE